MRWWVGPSPTLFRRGIEDGVPDPLICFTKSGDAAKYQRMDIAAHRRKQN